MQRFNVQRNIENIKIVLRDNSYPKSFVNKFIKKRIHNSRYKNNQRTCDDNKPKKFPWQLKNYHIETVTTMKIT